MMHKSFYASGFLYHSPSDQILLRRQSDSDKTSQWDLFRGTTKGLETTESSFRELISKLLHITIHKVHTVYSYVDDETNTHHSIVYSRLDTLETFSDSLPFECRWFSFKDVTKLPIAKQTKHDIVIGQRVIQAAFRTLHGERNSHAM
jgi:hypothetical protein